MKFATNLSGQIISYVKNSEFPLGFYYYSGGEEFRFSAKSCPPAILFAVRDKLLQVKTDRQNLKVNNNHVTLIRPKSHILIENNSSSQFVLFVPSDQLLKKVYRHCAIEVNSFWKLFEECKTIKGNLWIKELFHRYIFEMCYAKSAHNYVIKFLEIEICKELFFLFKKTAQDSDKKYPINPHFSYLTMDVMKFILDNLYNKIKITNLNKVVAASQSTILRHFKQDMKISPQRFLIERRLNEAKVLIKQNRYSIEEISFLLHYESPSAFIQSFKSHYKITPGEFRSKSAKFIINKL